MSERRISIAILSPDDYRAIVLDLDTGLNIASGIAACEENFSTIRGAIAGQLPLSVSLATMDVPPRIVEGRLRVWQAPYLICEVIL